jgi:hypothetical protein
LNIKFSFHGPIYENFQILEIPPIMSTIVEYR